MKKIVITLTAEQKLEMAKKLGIINDELIIMVPEEGEKNRDISNMENILSVTFEKE